MKETEGAMPEAGSAVICELAADIVRAFGTATFPATGSSMLPAVWPGDMLVVEGVRSHEVRMGDVLVSGRDGRLCGHRVIYIEKDAENPRWITQGDTLPNPDRPVRESELLGRVAYLIRSGKRVAVPAKLSVLEELIAGIVRRSVLAARALVYLRRLVQASKESVSPCQG